MTEEALETSQEAHVEAETVEPEAEVSAPQWSDEAEKEARKYGWRGRDEYDLAPDGWVDPERFLELPSTLRKQAQDESRNLRAELAARDEKIAGIERAAKAAVENARRQAEDTYKARLAAIERAQADAVENADSERFTELKKAERQLMETRPGREPTNEPNADVITYREKNAWAQDPRVWAAMVDIVETTPGAKALSGADQLKIAERGVRNLMPHLFEDPAPAKTLVASKTDPGGLGALPRGKKTAADLPPDARAIARDFVEEGVFKSVDEYAKKYFAEDGQ